MSSIEERLATDIAAVTGRVVVGESDARYARDAVQERIDSRRTRGPRHTVAAAAAAAAVIPVLGVAAFQTLGGDDGAAPPANPGPTTEVDVHGDFLVGARPTAQLINGVWRVDNGVVLMLFSEDGRMRLDDSGMLFSNPAVTGTYEIDGDLITVTMDRGPATCTGRQFTMRASLSAAGEMRFVHTQPAVEGCSPLWQLRGVLEQVLPTKNKYLSGFKVPAKGDWQPPVGPTSLHGDWMAEVTDPMPAEDGGGGGRVLEVAPDGRYTVAAGSGAVVDRGRWTFDSSASRLSLSSAGDSPTCDQGDHLLLSGVEQLITGTILMRATVSQNACGEDWASSNEWFLLPHEGSRSG